MKSVPMIKSKQKPGIRHQRNVKASARHRFLVAVTALIVVGIFAAVALLRAERGEFEPLKGRWLRTDGGYIFDVQTVHATGAIDAVYLNPKPINIARAEATREGTKLNVFVELRAPNYPGSTYTLTYNPQQDQLQGVYFQALQQQRFDVSFVRMK